MIKILNIEGVINFMSHRIDWIDMLKGLGIILVVFGHTAHAKDTIRILIYSFHMPMFFIISGYLFKTKDKYKNFLKKFMTLLLPYLIIV